ncbi:MAG: hypothetical protein J0H47_04950 [Gammaproteobacteria bacterium]|mgnify:CR=1 FL=1|nr:hypothetical protein [Gammaproteobacteria bacterium]
MKTNIHQLVTFYYLKEIQTFYRKNKMVLPVHEPYLSLQHILEEIFLLNVHFDSTQNYKKMYKHLHEAAEKVAEYELRTENRKEKTKLDNFFIKLFENDNKIDEKIYQNIIQSNITQVSLKQNIEVFSVAKNRFLHLSHPDNPLNAFYTSMLGHHYHPLKKNNIPYLAFEGLNHTGRKCLRIGAQTQGKDKVNPVFERYLLANARRKTKQKKQHRYDYVYINLLKTESSSQDKKKNGIAKIVDDFVRNSEGARASSLETLNFVKDLNAAVITLPADGDFFLGEYSMKKGAKTENLTPTSLHALLITVKESIQHNRNDFYMTKEVKRKLFGDNFNNGKIEMLFQDAVSSILGKQSDLNKIMISAEVRNAILFQFIKSNLTEYILKTLNPKAYNICCKDGIDRGAIHNLWHQMNLMHTLDQPMTKAQFYQYLDAPAIIVKYRPLNHNRNLIWNALRFRMINDVAFRGNHPWAIEWLKENVPHYVLSEEKKWVLDQLNKMSITINQPQIATTIYQESTKLKQKAVVCPLYHAHLHKRSTFVTRIDDIYQRKIDSPALAC